eukprot:CAMPEP_0119507814 /NCGR_PEP_ID=MMETSP1344-20130328/27602_1 /TAXON_ID=236787 /ORGANISM="Florenciella parvula, Strain CCMP2471" /LENGTH=72 /DNA_ID=CAMNT_0007544477 /DNA_START=1 /DNA_END=216 /DNA_ORIENTATION=-
MAAASPAPSHVGWLCKRYFRVNRWSERYFVIKGERIEYYPTIKDYETGREPKGMFTLTKGCCVSEITETAPP